MTTKVTVDAHAGWRVEVKVVDVFSDGGVAAESTTVVESHTTRDFYVHQGRELHIKELPQ